MLKVWYSLGTYTTWLGKYHGLGLYARFCSQKNSRKFSDAKNTVLLVETGNKQWKQAVVQSVEYAALMLLQLSKPNLTPPNWAQVVVI